MFVTANGETSEYFFETLGKFPNYFILSETSANAYNTSTPKKITQTNLSL